MSGNRKWEVWIGSYGAEDEVGITRLEMDADTGELAKTAEYGGIARPSFLAMNEAGTTLYAVSETSEVEGQPGGRMVAYPVEPDSRKLLPGWDRFTYGADPCHAALPRGDRPGWLAVANYSGSAVTLYTLEPDGKPSEAAVRLRHTGTGPHASRQEKAHPHSALFDPLDPRFLFVADLGIDRIMIYELGADGREWIGSDAVSLTPGDGPRHMAFSPDGGSFYVVNELSCTVTRFRHSAPGKLERLETVPTLPAGWQGENTCAEIAASPDGRHVYVSNRGHDSLAVFRVDAGTGELQPAGHVSTRGRTPRSFALTPDGAWLIAANQDSGNLVLYRVEPQSGLPVYAGTEISVLKPVCVRIRSLA